MPIASARSPSTTWLIFIIFPYFVELTGVNSTKYGKIMKINHVVDGLLALAMGMVLGRAAESSEATLKVGNPAPKLQVSKWVQGEPVKDFERDKAYIVEFWATWCGP